ncbi:MAG: Hpt domain-containing protein [Pseudanabaenaceae cyanobacterium bins.39]|nr:Hpt domain-containing protein [Pseudanabaenaceae cyanobacterium bins.39]
MNNPIFENKYSLIDKFLRINEHPDVINLPVLDQQTFSNLRSMIDDDLMFSDLVTVYLSSAENLIYTLQTSLDMQDFPTMKISAHSLKSTSASIGAVKLSQICKLIEQALKDGVVDIPVECINIISQEYDLAIIEIKKLCL